MTFDFRIKSTNLQLSKWVLCIYLMMFFLLIADSQPAFSQKCDTRIEPIKNWKLKYRKRDNNRCEGFYSSLVSDGVIDVVGVTKGEFSFEIKENEVLELSSPLVRHRPIYIRAVGIPLKLYYRMDAHLDAGKKLAWPLGDVVYWRKLSSKHICVFGWTGNEMNKTYIPVAAVSKLAPVKNDGKIRLYLRTSVDVINVKWRMAGTCSRLRDAEWQDAPKSSYDAGKPITIILPAQGVEELCLEVAAYNQKHDEYLKKKNIRVIVGARR